MPCKRNICDTVLINMTMLMCTYLAWNKILEVSECSQGTILVCCVKRYVK